MRFLVGTLAYNRHVQHAVLALHEAGALGAYHTGFVDNYRRAWLRRTRRLAGLALPTVDRELRRRRMTVVPDELVWQHWRWELPRTLASRLGLDGRVQDWLWEHGEHHLDRACARLLERPRFDAFLGTEHTALRAIQAARRLGKRSALTFLSPHHATLERWVHREYQRFPELVTPTSRRLLELARVRDARRDEEARLADVVLANSRFTGESLQQAGLPADKIVAVPLGAPAAMADGSLPVSLPEPLRFLYAGPVSVRKGAHYLIEAWKRLSPGRGRAELHFYGVRMLPPPVLGRGGPNVVLHGSVPYDELRAAYQQAAVLVFPTLCDGFGQVVSEALAHGLPVITTHNAGAADLIEEGRSGFLVPAGDTDALTDRMDWCLNHPEDLLEMRRHALAAARRWTWADFRARLRDGLGRALGVRLASRGCDQGSVSSPPGR